jgi:mycolipenoyl-CoA---2-(long-chain-fatty acyl)-trehalose mycolipenoyltransferase / long-chain-acyl-CoA---trehalose acyltransferase
MVTLGTINEWQPSHGPVTTWMASPAAHQAAVSARRGGLPPTYQRKQHLRDALDGKAMGRQRPRLMVVAWDMPGVCDIPAMTAAINADVRRHDAYHDWFEFEDTGSTGTFVRRSIVDPADIDFVAVDFGWMEAAQIRTHALMATPGTLEWECFTFGIIPRDVQRVTVDLEVKPAQIEPGEQPEADDQRQRDDGELQQ